MVTAQLGRLKVPGTYRMRQKTQSLPVTEPYGMTRSKQKCQAPEQLRVMPEKPSGWLLVSSAMMALGLIASALGLRTTATSTPAATISEVRVANVRDTSFTVSWVTDQLATGEVHYGGANGVWHGSDLADASTTDVPSALDTSLDQVAYDDRGAGTSDDTHYVTLTGLTPNTTYYFDVVSDGTTDDNEGAHYAVTTGPTLALPNSDTIYGQVFKACSEPCRREDGTTPAEGAIVYITLRDADGSGSPDEAAPLSALVEGSGYWLANLGNARTAGLTAYFGYSASGDGVELRAQGGGDGTAVQTVDTANDRPAPSMVLELCGLSGDVNADGGVDVQDIMKTVESWRLSSGDLGYDDVYDISGDGDINIVDIMLVAVHLGEACK